MSISSNPSHVLIARNSRSPANPHTTTRLPNPFPNPSTHSSLLFNENEDLDFLRDSGGTSSALRRSISETNSEEGEEDDLDFEIERTFRFREKTTDCRVGVGGKIFWVHSVPLRFSCTFFQSILEGNWAESSTAQFRSGSPSTISRLSISSSTFTYTSASTSTSSDPLPTEDRPSSSYMSSHESDLGTQTGQDSSTETEERPSTSFSEVSATTGVVSEVAGTGTEKRKKKKKLKKKKAAKREPDGVYASISLPAEEALAFHDFLHHLYPHLTLSINWDNVERLILFAHKYSVDSLLPLCISFLFSYAAGNPIKAMSIAELLSLPDVYKEASKFVLDNLPGWNQAELGTLSHETRWKLEKKRSWFLERLLKLSLNNVARDYPCAPTCPDPTHCSRLLDEKWRQAYLSANRFGSPQPSIVYRYLRQLDVPPFLMLERSACDQFGRGWVLDLFDRMFSLPLAANATGPGVVLLNNSKYFLSISLN